MKKVPHAERYGLEQFKISKRMYCIQHYTYDDTANNQKKDRKKKKRVHRVI